MLTIVVSQAADRQGPGEVAESFCVIQKLEGRSDRETQTRNDVQFLRPQSPPPLAHLLQQTTPPPTGHTS